MKTKISNSPKMKEIRSKIDVIDSKLLPLMVKRSKLVEKALELPDKAGLKLVEYALSKKVTLCGPSMLFLIFKVVEYFWKADKQSKNILDVIELANKISTQTVDIYNSAKKAQDSIQKSSLGVSEVMDKIKDGKGSLLSKTSKMNKIGGLTPKKLPPNDIEDDQDKIDG